MNGFHCTTAEISKCSASRVKCTVRYLHRRPLLVSGIHGAPGSGCHHSNVRRRDKLCKNRNSGHGVRWCVEAIVFWQRWLIL